MLKGNPEYGHARGFFLFSQKETAILRHNQVILP